MTDAYQNPLPGLLQWVLKGQARHGLTYVAGLLSAWGALPNQAAVSKFEELGMSLILFIGGCVWSAMEKKAVSASKDPPSA